MDNFPQERRKHARVQVHFSVFYRVDRPLEVRMRMQDVEVNAVMLDLSEGGISLSTSFDIPKDTLLSIKFTLINEHVTGDQRTKSMWLDGEVRNNVLVAQKEYRLGIEFNYLAVEDKTALRQFVAMLSNPPTA